MIPLTQSDQINFLLYRKFPIECLVSRRTKIKEHVQSQPFMDYKKKLLSMPKAELQALYAKEKEQQSRDNQQANQNLQEKLRFFNLSTANADYGHWSKATYWTLDEAVALSFGKAPEVVNWASIKPCTKISAFAANYARTRDLVFRACAWQQLYDPVQPGFFLAWAKRNDLPYPSELEEQVKARGQQIADWKTAYDQLKVQLKEQLAAHKQQIADWIAAQHEIKAALAKLTEERDQAIEQLRLIEQASQANPAPAKALLTRERESALKLIIGMAIRRYRYDPKAPRNEATIHIAEDLDQLGLSLDSDTVRKWLKEGAELIPAKGRRDR